MSTDLGDVLGSVLPVLILIALGMVLRRINVLNDSVILGLKRLIVSVALPALLFTTFLKLEFAPEHVWVITTAFGVCLLLLGLGYLYRRIVGGSAYSPLLFTGFELGMIGFALFAAVYGTDQLPALGVLALGHEVFIWFIFVTLLRAVGNQRETIAEVVRSLITSPVIIAILAGITLNALGMGRIMEQAPIGTAIQSSLGYLAAMIVPLVLLIIGYGTRLSLSGVREALPLVATRLVVVITLALTISAVVFTGLLDLPPIYSAALFTLLILPPPYIVPLFIPPERKDDLGYANNVISLYTLLSILSFVSYVLITG
jgi:predicted permease